MIRKISALLLILSAILLLMSYVGADQAQFVEKHIAFPIRSLFAGIFDIIRIPAFELFLIGSPLLFALALVRRRGLALLTLIAVLLFSSYCINLAIPANAESISEQGSGEPDMALAARLIADKLNSFGDVLVSDTEDTCMAVTAAVEKYASLQSLPTDLCSVKPSVLSSIFDRMGILALYAFPTGEVIVNTSQPQFMLPFSAAHEYMHYLGISREDEADISAFTALESCGDEALEYSAYITAFSYVGGALYKASADDYWKIYDDLSDTVKDHLSERGEYLRDIGTNKFSALLNNAAISMRDSRGSASYSNSARLIAAIVIASHQQQ